MATFYLLGAKAVATCATLSLAATLSLGLFIAYLTFRYRKVPTMNTPPSTGIRFLRTPAGFIFLNLLAADATQALGFGLTWVWASHGSIEHNANLCLFQALAIQSGDVASAVFSFFIAFYTAVLLTTSRKLSDNLLYIAAGGSWIFVAFATFIGPLAIAKKSEGAFYGEAGNWCWISNSYSEMRLWLHYFFLFLSAAGQIAAYLAIFLVIRFRWLPQQRFLKNMERENGGMDMSDLSQVDEYIPSDNQSTKGKAAPVNSKKFGHTRMLDRTSMIMLIYPLVNLSVIMPLSVYRVMALAGKPGSPEALAACGCIFSLGGLANALLYTFSRHLLSVHPKREEQATHPFARSVFKKPSKHALYGSTKVTFPTIVGTNASAMCKIDNDDKEGFTATHSDISLTLVKPPTRIRPPLVPAYLKHASERPRSHEEDTSVIFSGITVKQETFTSSDH